MQESILGALGGPDETQAPTEFVYFDRLRSDVKSYIDLELRGCTALIGSNRKGKSGTLDTVGLALTGIHPIGKVASDLGELLQEGAESMFVTLSGPSGIAKWSLDAPGGKARKPEPPQFMGPMTSLTEFERTNIIPLRGIVEMLKYGKDRMREALMRRFGVVHEIPVPLGLSSEQSALWEEARQECGGEGTDPSEQIAAMAKWLRAKARKHSGEAKSLAEAIELRKTRLAEVSVGGEMVDEYEQALIKAEAWESSANLRAQRNDLRARSDQVAPFFDEAAHTELENRYNKLQRQSFETSQAVELGTKWLEMIDSAGGGHQCPMCSTDGVNLEGTQQAIAQRVEARKDQLQLIMREAAELKALVDAGGQTRITAQQITGSNAIVLQQLIQVEDRLRELGAPDTYDGPTAQSFRDEIQRVRDQELTRKQLLSDTEEMHRLQLRSEVCKVLERQAAKLLKELLQDVRSTAEATFNKYMPDGYQVKVVISDKAVEWRVIGDDGRPHKRGGMSGSEFGSLVVAAACAWTEGSPLRVLLLDDVDVGTFDTTNFQALLNKLKAAQERGDLTQVIIAGWRDDVPNDWHKIYLGRDA